MTSEEELVRYDRSLKYGAYKSEKSRESISRNKNLFNDEPLETEKNERSNKQSDGYKIVSNKDFNESEKDSSHLLSSGEERFSLLPGTMNPFMNQSTNLVNLSETFMHMNFRKLKRASSGSYKDKPRGEMWSFYYLLIFTGYLTYRLYFMQLDGGLNHSLFL